MRTISRYLEQNGEELSENGYEVLRGKNLKSFLDAARNSGKDINVPTKTTVLGVFHFRAFLNMAINRKTGGGTKYINQRDKDFLFSALQEDNYRRQFTDALKNYVEDNRYKYAHFTDMIYVSIFKEKAKNIKKFLI